MWAIYPGKLEESIKTKKCVAFLEEVISATPRYTAKRERRGNQEKVASNMVCESGVDTPPIRVKKFAQTALIPMRSDAERIATSPVPPRPLWRVVTIDASTGYMLKFRHKEADQRRY